MLNLFRVKENNRTLREAQCRNQTAATLRLHRDISELNLPSTCGILFPNNGNDDLMNFEITICPDEGYYEGGKFIFSFNIPSTYPHESPKVKCKTKIFHPNFDSNGNICLNILREDWKPVLSINSIIYGLYHLFTEPSHEDPLNEAAANMLKMTPEVFGALTLREQSKMPVLLFR